MAKKGPSGRKTGEKSPRLIVGVGASAGGLEAFQELLAALDEQCGLAIVFVQHLYPQGENLLPGLLAKTTTSMPVVALSDRTRLEADTIYVAPPGKCLELRQGVVRVVDVDTPGPSVCIDHFFHSLAEDQGARGVGIILSGSGSDGTLGLKAIGDAGGVTFAQEPGSAMFDSMPRNAATTGVSDHVLSPAEIAAELVEYVKYFKEAFRPSRDEPLHQDVQESIPAISELLLKVTSHDFQHYKTSTLTRGIQQRMRVLKLSTVDDYVALLTSSSEETQTLFRKLLIGVTAFFRDPGAFSVLAETVLPSLFENRRADDPVRIWVPGCATGEEAYTIAILCREQMEHWERPCEVQIFATDIDQRALHIARQGTYPVGIHEDLSPARLKRFFVRRGKRYHVVKEVREMVLFSPHNLISDPPYSRLDLISCRNLLIYLGPHLQKKLIPLFHYALRPSGYLFLGPSENISSHRELFRTLDAKHRVSQRKGTGAGATAALSLTKRGGIVEQDRHAGQRASSDSADLLQIMQRIVLDEFAPKSVIVDEDGQVLCASADMQKYLTVAGGNFQNNVIKMARSGLRIGLRTALKEAITTRRRTVHDDLSVRIDQRVQRVMLTVQPMPRLGEESGLFMIVFHDVGLPLQRDLSADATPGDEQGDLNADSIIAQLERELTTTREDLEKAMQDMETANEELKSSNEELLSLNEELQSANEELETSKEEIQAGGDALAQANSYLENLLRSTRIATVFLDDELRIRSFTPAATEIYGMIATDIGRPLSQLMPLTDNMPPLPDPATVTADEPIEHMVRTYDGRSFIRRVLPYQTHAGQIEGIVVTFTDVSDLKESEELLCRSLEAAHMDALEIDLRTDQVWRKGSLMHLLGLPEVGTLQAYLEQLPPEDGVALKAAIRGCSSEQPRYTLTYQYCLRDDTRLWLRDDAVVLFDDEGRAVRIVGSCRDVTLEKQAERELAKRERQLRMITDATPAQIAYVDAQCRYRFVNRRYEKEFDLAADLFIGRTVREVVGEENYAQIRPRLEAALTGESQTFELAMTVPHDGTKLIKEVTYIPDCREDGSVDGCYVLIIDISERKRALQVIADREQQLSALISSTAEGIYGVDLAGICTFANAACARLLGYHHPDELIGKRMHDLIHRSKPQEDPSGNDECLLLRSLRDGSELHVDDQLFWRADGSCFDAEYWSYPLLREGQMIGCVVTFLDVTQRRTWEREISDREAHLRRVLDNTLGLVGVLDRDGTLREANATAIRAAGITRADVVGKKFWDCYWWNYDPKVAAQNREAVQRAAAGEIVRYDVTVRMANDTRMTIDFMLAPVRDADGSITHLIPSGMDISERKATEQALAENRERLSLAMEFSRMGSYVWEPETDRVVWNEQHLAITGLPRAEMKGADFLGILHPDDVEMNKRAIERTISGEVEDYDVEFRIIRPDGQLRWLAARGKVIPGENGEPLKFVGLNWDITQQKQASEAIRLGETRLQRIIDGASVGIVFVRSTGEVLRANEAALDILGIEELRLTREGCNLNAALQPEDTGVVAMSWVPLWESGALPPRECQIRRADASLLPVMISGLLVDADNDEYVAFLVDLTQQKEQQRVLRANEERLRLAYRAANLALWDWDIANDQITWSHGVGDLSQMRETESVGDLQELIELIHPADREQVQQAIRQSLDDGSPLQVEFRIKRRDGQYRWLLTMGQLSFSDDDTPARMIGVELDITARKESEQRAEKRAATDRFLGEASESLAASLDYQRTLTTITQLAIPALADWAWLDLVDDDGQMHRVGVAHADSGQRQLCDEVARNPARLDILARFSSLALLQGEACLVSEVTEQMLVDATRGAEHEAIMRAVAPCSFIVVPLIARGVRLGDLTLIMSQSGRRYGEDDLVVTKELARRAAIAVDNARLYEAGQQANVSKSQFLANMSHEIRTPMTAVLGYTDLLVAREEDPEKVEYLRTIKRNGVFLLDIINDVLDLSKIEAGKLEILRERFSPHEVVGDVRSMMDVRAKEKQIKFEIHYEGLIPAEIEGDPKRLKQILVNLLGNAIKFTQQGSVRLVVRFLPGEEPHIRFDVVDTGIGMTDEQQMRLFEPFSQGDSSVTRSFGGTGLGLAISQRLANMLGGEITLQSSLNQGSTFSFATPVGDLTGIPLIEPRWDLAKESQPPPSIEECLKCRVLIVDDRRDVRFLARHILTKAGAEVVEAEDGQAAIEAIQRMFDGGPTFDLVLLDMQMPRLDGYQTASHLRKAGFQRPIIALTADAMHGDMSRCLESGCDAYLSKPIDASSLVELVLRFTEPEGPAASDQKANSVITDDSRGAPSVPSSMTRVMIVDDSIDACTAMQGLLRLEGFEVEVAYDGKSALELATAFLPRFVILDIGLGSTSGYEVLQSLKQVPGLAETRFFALTGRSQEEDIKRSLAAGFHHHLTKPIDLATILDLLHSKV